MRSLVLIFLLLPFFLILFFGKESLIGLANNTLNSTSRLQANATIAKVKAYVDMLNTSGYLVFSPNLTLAYKYLQMAEKAENTSPESAIAYAQLAYKEATQAYAKLDQYRAESAIVMLALTVAFAAILYRIMKKQKTVGRKQSRGPSPRQRQR
ncbi:MAG: hypothetical protein ACP5GD_02810 [Candidatus Micrarchaeia archaeon]